MMTTNLRDEARRLAKEAGRQWIKDCLDPTKRRIGQDELVELVCESALLAFAKLVLEQQSTQIRNAITSDLFTQFLRQEFWHAHHVDLVWRYNGIDVREQADWLKDLWYMVKDRAITAELLRELMEERK